MLRIALVLFIVGEAVAQIVFPGRCVIPKSTISFNVDELDGQWYEFAMSTVRPERREKCFKAVYTARKDGSFKLKTTQTSIDGNRTHSYEYGAVPIGKPSDGNFFRTPEGDIYSVVDMSTNWAIVSSCKNFDMRKSIRTVWAYTKEKDPRQDATDALQDSLRKNNLNDDNLFPTNKQDCPTSY